MDRRAKWILLLGAGVVAFAIGAAWWFDFLYSDSCYDAGGIIEDGKCVDARNHISFSLRDASWQGMLISLVPPTVFATLVVIVAWLGTGSRGQE